MLARLRHLIVTRILGVQDSPGRIARGVALGMIVAWTPTLGFQIMLYVAVATLFRANKVAGIPVLFISNPLTAVPLYWGCWRLGDWLVNGGSAGASAGAEAIARLGRASESAAHTSWWHDIWTAQFWEILGETLLDLGLELWVGSLVVGVTLAVPSYLFTLYGVRSYRRARGQPV